MHRGLRHPVADGRYPKGPQFAIGLGDMDAPHSAASIVLLLEGFFNFFQEGVHPLRVDMLNAHAIDSRRSCVGPDFIPGRAQRLRMADPAGAGL